MKVTMAAVFLAAIFLCGCGRGGEMSTDAPPAGEKGMPESAEARLEEFGAEAEGEARTELLAIFHGYLGALANGDEAVACKYLGSRVKESFAELAGSEEAPPCAKALEAILSPAARVNAAQQAKGEIKRVREGEGVAFVIYHAPGARLYQLNLEREQGAWKVALLSPAILAPTINPTREGES